VGVRWSKQRERIKFSVEGRGMAGANFMTGKQEGFLGSNLGQLLVVGPLPAYTSVTNGNTVLTYQTATPQNPGGSPATPRVNHPLMLNPTSFTSSTNWIDFSPVVELRAKLSYQLFRSASFTIGYTGLWVNNVARAPNMINWTLPNFGVLRDTTHQSILI